MKRVLVTGAGGFVGARILDTAEALRAGSKRYRLVSLDE